MHSTSGIPVGGMMCSDFSVSVTRDAALDDELLRERLAEAHVHAALDLAFDEHRVDRLADVVGGDHLLEPPLVVEDRRPASPQA